MFGFMRIARQFMADNLPFWEMAPADNLLSGENSTLGGGEVFAKAGEVYAVYLPNASNSNATLDLTGDTRGRPEPRMAADLFSQRWFNPPPARLSASSRASAATNRSLLARRHLTPAKTGCCS